MPRIAIIGGSGVYNPERFELIKKVFPDTPYGKPSDEILIGKINGVEVAFLPRHGNNHQHPPSSVPYRANIYALKQLGVEMIISPDVPVGMEDALDSRRFAVKRQKLIIK